jgi:thimet oligopeptidase
MFSVRVQGRHVGRPFACTLVATFLLLGSITAQQPGPSTSPATSLTQTEAIDTPFTAGIADAASLQRVVEGRITRVKQLLDSLINPVGPRDAVNTLEYYDEMHNELSTASSEAELMATVHPDEAMRKAGTELERRVSDLEAEIQLRPDVFKALQGLHLTGLDRDSRYYVERELRDLRRLGVDRPAATRARLQKLRDELTVLMAEYLRNIREHGRRFTVPAKDLDGLPADFIARHQPDAAGAITLTSDNVDSRPVLTYAKSETLRKRMYIESNTVAYPENVAVLDKILAVRNEIAGVLGYPNWASYDMSSRMAGDVKTVSTFIDRVVAAAAPKATREYETLLKLKRQDIPGASLQVWDRVYYAEVVRRASYDFDSQVVRPYFAFDRVLAGLLDTTGRIFGVTYRPATGVAVWHPSVRVYEMVDEGRLLGRVYLDLNPRANKPATTAFVTAIRQGAEDRQIPEVVLVASVSGGRPGDPGLMTHDEVRTLFHEFGHVIHRVVGGHRKWYGLSSVYLERDFVEAPSQMLEEWIWDPATLATFAKHYESGEAIPSRLVMQMRRASEFGQGLEVRGQMVLARVSLSYHDRKPDRVDTTALWKEIQNRYLPYPHPDGVFRQGLFTHLANPGYASAYYTYMWSLVIAKDLFSGFDARTLSAPGAARRYRETIFAPGSSKPAATLVRDFLGRPFTFAAWENWLNRETPAVSTN